MSGISGLYYFNDRHVISDEITMMAASMAHRGPDGIQSWSNGSVGLGHCLLQTTPESRFEKLPTTSESPEVVITADARIDNRTELFSQLKIKADSTGIPDGELIRRAYLKWDKHCVEHLLGDFGFAIWDNRKKHLFMARDHFGIKQLYYSLNANRLLFGTEIKAILAHPDMVEVLNESVAGIYLAGGIEPKETIFNGIVRLLPGYAMVASPDQVESWKYWELEPAHLRQDLDDDAYTEQFLDLFTEAVRTRMRSEYPIGTELSGGLDSSFVTLVAKNLLDEVKNQPLHTISTVYDVFKECDERAYINTIIGNGDFISHYCTVDKHSMTDILDEVYTYLDDGRVSGNHHLNWLTARTAGNAGVRVLLTGQDGDLVIGHGWQFFNELARTGQWKRFAEEARETVDNLNSEKSEIANQIRWTRPEEVLAAYGHPYLMQLAAQKKYIKLVQALLGIKANFAVSIPKILYGLRKKILAPYLRNVENDTSTLQVVNTNLISSEFAQRINLEEELNSTQINVDKKHSVRETQKKLLESPYLAMSLEKIEHYGAAGGVEIRHPFMDKRLVEFCLGLPVEQSYANGWSRVILRRAMKGIVPEKIRRRTDKADLSAPFIHLYSQGSDKSRQSWSEKESPFDDYIDIDYFNRLYENMTDLTPDETMAFSRTYNFLQWMKRRLN